jgi:hypothetical protein
MNPQALERQNRQAAGWIAEVKADWLVAATILAQLAPRQTVTDADMRVMIDEVEDKVRMLAEADPETKNALYAALGIRLTYEPERNAVLVEAQPTSWALDRVGGPTCNFAPRPVILDSGWSELRRAA